MKKIFTLLAGVLVAGSAFALPVQKQEYKASLMPQLAQRAEVQTQMVVGESNGIKRAMQDDKQQMYDAVILKMGTTSEMLGLYRTDEAGNKIPTPFEDFPMYIYQMVVSSEFTPETILNFIINWPSKAMCDSRMISDGKVDWSKSEEVFGSLEAAQAPVSIEELLKVVQENTLPVISSQYIYQMPYIFEGIGITQVHNGKQNLGMKGCTLTDNGYQLDGSYFNWKAFDPDTYESTFNIVLQLGNVNNQGQVSAPYTAANINITGEPTALGLRQQVLNFDELHIFDCGLTDNDTYYGTAYSEKRPFGPINRYYFAFCDPTISWMAVDKDGKPVYAWNENEDGPLSLETMKLFQFQGTTPVFTYYKGALYFGKDEKFEGIWDMPEPKYTTKKGSSGYEVIDEWLSVPTSKQLIPWDQECAEAAQDGVRGAFQGWGANPGPNVSRIGVGDKNLGFNVYFSQQGWEQPIIGSFTGNYKFHPNMNNWDEMKDVPAVGTADANVVSGATSVEAIESNAPVVSTQYFNLQGQRLNVAPEKGIFIQRNIKADGTVKAVKVVK